MRAFFAAVPLIFAAFASTASDQDATLRIVVRAPDGSPIHNSYVAAVPEHRPWARPLAETVAERGTAQFRLPAGNYRLVAIASGFGGTTLGPIALTPASKHELAPKLTAMKPVHGTVSDSAGNPIAGARVFAGYAAGPPGLGRFSELQLRTVLQNWSTVTDKNGGWTLALPTDSATPLIAEKNGYASLGRLFRPLDSNIPDFVLPAGAALKLNLDRADPRLVVTLRSRETGSNLPIPADWQAKVWAQRPTTKLLAWSSLPPGSYDVIAKYTDPKAFGQTYKTLTTITLAAGDRVERRTSLPAPTPVSERVARLFMRRVPEPSLRNVEGYGANADGVPIRLAVSTEEVVGGTILYIDAEGVRGTLYAVTNDHFISAEAGADVLSPIDPPSDGALYDLSTAFLNVRSAEANVSLPNGGKAVFNECPRGVRLTSAIEMREGRGRFAAPAGCRTAVLQFEPFEALVIERRLEPGDQSLGDYLLRLGGAADIHVTRQSGTGIVPGATVRVLERSEQEPDRRLVPVAEGVSGDDGWAHLTGLPANRALKAVAETKEGLRSADADFEVAPGGRAVVDPLRVSEPATLIVEAKVDDLFRARFPSARIVLVFVAPSDAYRKDEEQRRDVGDDHSGALRFEHLRPGDWQVSALIQAAGTYSLVKGDELALESGDTRRITVSFQPLAFSGVVSENGKGVAARVTFSRTDGRADGWVQQTDSNADGTFHLLLTTTGTYSVEVARLRSQGDIVPIGNMELTDPARPIEIVIPRTVRVAVHVHAGERAIEAAMVSLVSQGDDQIPGVEFRRGRYSDPKGDAIFDSIARGPWIVRARDEKSGKSGEKAFLVDDKDVDVQLDLQPAPTIQGTIADDRGSPIPRVRVECLFSGAGGTPVTSSADSDSQGRFEVDLTENVSGKVLCALVTPFGMVDAFIASPGETSDRRTPGVTGTLRIADWAKYLSRGQFWLVADDGRAVNLTTVAQRIGKVGAPLTIPSLASGRWRIVRVRSLQALRALIAMMSGSLEAVARVNLTGGTAETINIYGAAETSIAPRKEARP